MNKKRCKVTVEFDLEVSECKRSYPVEITQELIDIFKENIEKYPQFQTAIDQLHDSAPQYAGALLSVFSEARAIVETEIENMLNGKQSPQEAVDKMASDINTAIEDYNLVNEE